MELIWAHNPYVDGFTDLFGRAPYTLSLPLDLREMNLLDFIMLGYGLDDGVRFHEPEIYYKPNFRPEFNKVIFDPNWFSNVGNLTICDIEAYFKAQGITIKAVLKKRNDKALFNYNKCVEIIETPTLEEFCDLIYSAKELYCLTTGTATLASALRKSCVVLYGNGIGAGRELAQLNDNVGSLYHHSKLHKYILIKSQFVAQRQSKFRKFRHKIKRAFQKYLL